MSIRAATAQDIGTFYPDITSSFRAWVAEIDGEVQGIIGLALTRPYACIFSAVNEPLKPLLKSMAILKLIKRVESLFKKRGLPVLAIAEPDLLTAPAILKRLGFEYLEQVDGDAVWIWWGS